ncbi:DUF2793 domain-containing protein [Tateyamaria omphalii]|uniref:DUF2793 domain-containing protein n=1 Tax=Tateyamaria omphalii TaxID=299262 RepID=A0A1P8N2F6_9RHOB|nr:DUF2793 domain-containing protein [Tateyamaria omphalii]APX14369.1 hypothetical protein BWR18_21260 [Tateyamaria omphalii]
MSDTSPLLALPYIQPSQAQKHVTHNEALRLLDAIVQPAVETLDLNTPPLVPDVGARHVVGPLAGGAWAGHAGKLAVWQPEGVWLFLTPVVGWTVYVQDVAQWAAFDGTAWALLEGALPDQAPQLGLNTSADATNRLAVAADATLLTHEGAGHQLKLNKNAATDTASLLFQTGFGGRAEMGLTGEDAFSVKVSADGASWSTALRADPASGAVTFPGGGVRPAATGPITYYVDPVQGSDAADGRNPGAGAFASLPHAMSIICRFDALGHDVEIQLADGTHTLPAPIVIDHPLPGIRDVVVRGNAGDQAAVTLSGPDDLFRLESCRVRLVDLTLESTGSGSFLVVSRHGAQVVLDSVVFGAAGKGHMDLEDGSVYVTGACRITSGAQFHARLELSARLSINQADYTLTGTPDFAGMFIKCGEVSVARVRDTTFTGGATGQRYFIYENALLSTGNAGATFLPGNAAGTTSQGGRYR